MYQTCFKRALWCLGKGMWLYKRKALGKSPVCTQGTSLIPFQPFLTRRWKPDGGGGRGQAPAPPPHALFLKPGLVFIFLRPLLQENPTGWCWGQFSKDGNSRHGLLCRRAPKGTHRSTVGIQGCRNYRNGGQTDCLKGLTPMGMVVGHGSAETQVGTPLGMASAEIHSPGAGRCPPKEC